MILSFHYLLSLLGNNKFLMLNVLFNIKIEYICDFGLSEKTCLLQAITEAYRRLIKTYFEG